MFHRAHHLDVVMAGLFLAAALSGEVLRRFATLCSARDTASASCILCTYKQVAAVSITKLVTSVFTARVGAKGAVQHAGSLPDKDYLVLSTMHLC